MSPEQFQKIQACFLEAVELPEGERTAFLDAQCKNDTAMRVAVEDLLIQDADPLRLSGAAQMRSRLADLYEEATSGADRPVSPAPESSRPARIGRYRITDKIGEGGFGVVYKAEQTSPVKRTVAVKVIKLGMDTRQIIARFNSEFRALGKMKHPHIAHFLEAGHTETGQPFFVMEFVEGMPIHEFCDQRRLDLRARIELFVKVCGAVQHAHTKAVIHRDLKPSNVLVENVPHGEATPKIIDFGIAKAMAADDDAHSALTQQGQVIGTPAYMSPEQLASTEKDVDTRSDVYSLGVLLYELLTGTVPFDSGKSGRPGFAELQRLIQDVDPPRPSACVRARRAVDGAEVADPGSSAQRLAERRRMEPTTLQRQLRGDLDWIVMKAIEKAPDRRYQSAQALAEDLGRYLADEPVTARPPTTSYRLRKFARRHRGALTAGGVIVVLLAAGILTSAIGWARAAAARDAETAQRQRADQEAAIAKAVQSFLTDDLLSSVAPEAQGFAVSMRSVLDTAARKLETMVIDQPRVEMAVRLAIGRTYRALGRLDDAEPHLHRALALAMATLGSGHPETLDVEFELSKWNLWQGKNAEAERLARRVLEGRRQVFGSRHPKSVEACTELAAAIMEQQRLSEALALFREAEGIALEISGMESELTIAPMHGMALVLTEMESTRREFSPATTALFDQVVAASRSVHGDDHPSTLRRMNDLAVRLTSTGRNSDAERLYVEVSQRQERIQGRHHPGTMQTLINIARLQVELGHLEEAAVLLEELRAAGLENYPGLLVVAAVALARVRGLQQRFEEGEAILQQELRRLQHLPADSRPIRSIKQALSWLHASRSEADPSRKARAAGRSRRE